MITDTYDIDNSIRLIQQVRSNTIRIMDNSVPTISLDHVLKMMEIEALRRIENQLSVIHDQLKRIGKSSIGGAIENLEQTLSVRGVRVTQ